MYFLLSAVISLVLVLFVYSIGKYFNCGSLSLTALIWCAVLANAVSLIIPKLLIRGLTYAHFIPVLVIFICIFVSIIAYKDVHWKNTGSLRYVFSRRKTQDGQG